MRPYILEQIIKSNLLLVNITYAGLPLLLFGGAFVVALGAGGALCDIFSAS
jgi:hypothetical protein